MSKNNSSPYNRVIVEVDRIADVLTGTDDVENPSGNRLADSLQRIADHIEGGGAVGGGTENQAASTAADVAGIVADFNSLLNKMKNAGIMTPDTMTLQFATVTDSVAGHADRQHNTGKISSVAEEDGVITITLSEKVSNLKDFDGKNGWGVHKWLGIGIGAGISPITGLKYNGTALSAEDVNEATTCGLSAGYFVRWVAADLVLAGDNSEKSKDTFTLWADGYGTVSYKLSIVEP